MFISFGHSWVGISRSAGTFSRARTVVQSTMCVALRTKATSSRVGASASGLSLITAAPRFSSSTPFTLRRNPSPASFPDLTRITRSPASGFAGSAGRRRPRAAAGAAAGAAAAGAAARRGRRGGRRGGGARRRSAAAAGAARFGAGAASSAGAARFCPAAAGAAGASSSSSESRSISTWLARGGGTAGAAAAARTRVKPMYSSLRRVRAATAAHGTLTKRIGASGTPPATWCGAFAGSDVTRTRARARRPRLMSSAPRSGSAAPAAPLR